MDSSYPSSPVTGPLSRGQRRASEVSIASQVSGMADSYTASNIANSKCSQYQPASLSLSSTHTNTGPLILSLCITPTLLCISVSFLSSFILSLSDSTHTLHQPSQTDLPPCSLSTSAQPDVTAALSPRLFVQSPSAASRQPAEPALAPLSTVCLTLIHCLDVNAMNRCCIYLTFAMHVEHLPPSAIPASSTPHCSVCQDDQYSVLLCVGCVLRKHPLPSRFHFCFVPTAFILLHIHVLAPTVRAWKCRAIVSAVLLLFAALTTTFLLSQSLSEAALTSSHHCVRLLLTNVHPFTM